jgi:hypothetical protein
MQFALGALSASCIALIIAIAIVSARFKRTNRRFSVLDINIEQLTREISRMSEILKKFPAPVQNVIHLGLKDGRVTTNLSQAKLAIRPEDFQIRADKLKEQLLRRLETEGHEDIGTRAYCILDHAGMSPILNSQSFAEAKAALVRLLINGDNEATRRFLETLAESVAEAFTPPTSNA